MRSRNWCTQFLTIVFEIPAVFEYIDLRPRARTAAQRHREAFHGIYSLVMALSRSIMGDARPRRIALCPISTLSPWVFAPAGAALRFMPSNCLFSAFDGGHWPAGEHDMVNF